jgi:hypothetical protein
MYALQNSNTISMKFLYVKMSPAQNSILLTHLVLKINFFDPTYQGTCCQCLFYSFEEIILVMQFP